MMKKMQVALIAAGAVAMAGGLLLSGCKSEKDFRDERAEYAVLHSQKAKYRDQLEGKKMGLLECMRYALEHNLDVEVNKVEEAVAREMRTAEMLGMLPELTVTDTFTARNNLPASSSENIYGDAGGTYSYSQSQDRALNYLNVDLALSVLDFGLAFFNTQQADDRALLRKQRTERAMQNLTLDVAKAYFQVAAAQKAINITEPLLEECRTQRAALSKLVQSRQITPFRGFDETKRFVNMEKRLTAYIRAYENSCVELRSLMGMYPAGKLVVDDNVLRNAPDFNLPEIELMEQIALLQRPELYEIDIQKHINIIECRKTILQMFPNVRIYGDFTHSTNSFLYHMSWWELGVRAAYNLLKLPKQIATYMAYSRQVEAEELRTFAQAIGVMAQVRIAHANMFTTKERYNIDNENYRTYASQLKTAIATKQTAGALSTLELVHMRLETAETEIERLLSLGNYYISYYRLLNALGVRDLNVKTVKELKAELAQARERAREEMAKAQAEYDEKRVARVASSPLADDMTGKTVSKPLTKFDGVDFIAIYDAAPLQ
ncbi:MAG: TolC family protein [Lentisphaeria bacterium]|nr:TolC family protein [Lentisphaeria bacterium]